MPVRAVSSGAMGEGAAGRESDVAAGVTMSMRRREIVGAVTVEEFMLRLVYFTICDLGILLQQ